MTAVRVPLCLQVSVPNINQYATWDIDDGTGDPFIGYPYQWEVELDVQAQPHSNPTTPTPYAYNALDVKLGSWLIFSGQIFAVKIIGIDSDTRTDSYLKCIVEDVDRFNLFSDPNQSGSGIGATSSPGVYDCFIVEISTDGMPIFNNLSVNLSPFLMSQIEGRFRYRNETSDYLRVYQPGHGLSLNDSIILQSDGMYVKSTAATTDVFQTIGRVTSINIPSQDWFAFRPIGELVDIELPGNKGDLVYIGTDGAYTTTKPTNAKLVYIKFTDTQAFALEGDFGVIGGTSTPSPYAMDVYTFNLVYDADGNLSDITGLPTGWTFDTINSNSDVVINHSTGKVPKFCTIFGASVLVSGERRLRVPNVVNELVYNVGMPSQFKVIGLTATKAGTGQNGSAVFNVFF